ncbi:MAG: hypothetical protein KDC10_11925 [Calditrichaeota bacterium]|nr:hypothetical protein [Calditrichota bacterium]MCB9474442.1 hypothetical protein [Candidatus Delongbacteria bacterium]
MKPCIAALLLLAAQLPGLAATSASEHFTLQQWGLGAGSNPANPPVSANFRLEGSALGILSGADTGSETATLKPGYYLGVLDGDILPPEIVSITADESTVSISWLPVAGAHSYRVYSSAEAYSGFSLDTGGAFDGTSWSAPAAVGKRFFYVAAVY